MTDEDGPVVVDHGTELPPEVDREAHHTDGAAHGINDEDEMAPARGDD